MRGFILVLMVMGLTTACGGVESEAVDANPQGDDSGDKSAQVVHCTSCNVLRDRCIRDAGGDPVEEGVCNDMWVDCQAICI